MAFRRASAPTSHAIGEDGLGKGLLLLAQGSQELSQEARTVLASLVPTFVPTEVGAVSGGWNPSERGCRGAQWEEELGGASDTVGGKKHSRSLTLDFFKKEGGLVFTPLELEANFETICSALFLYC